MSSLPFRSIFRTQDHETRVETAIAQASNSAGRSSRILTRVNGVFVYVPGLTSVDRYTTNKEALEHHNRWVSAIIHGVTPEAPVAAKQRSS